MRIDVRFRDRVGIAQEILARLAAQNLNLTAVEVAPPHVFIEAPQLAPGQWSVLRANLKDVPGVAEALIVDMLPGARQRLHLDALMAAMKDPVLLADAEGALLAVNEAARRAAGRGDVDLTGLSIGALFDDAALQRELTETGFDAPSREVILRGRAFQLDIAGVSEDGRAAGGVLTLYSPERIGARMQALRAPAEGLDALVGASPAMNALKQRAARLAPLSAPLLILGETGTGKELVAQACHHLSPRRRAPFLALNCAAVPENLAESELFGYAPGAFSGASRGGKPGLLEMAAGGTVFLDEIGEMSLYLQAKLLRFLNDGSFRRVGGDRELRVDVRIISATHRDLSAMVASGAFREDLYYRLDVLRLNVPPLRERGDDVLLLARHFIERAAAQTGRSGARLSAAGEAALRAADWPGNVRQLENLLFRAVALSDDAEIEIGEEARRAETPREGDEPADWRSGVEAYERGLLTRLLPRFPSSRKLAERLGVSHTMIARKLQQYGLTGGGRDL
ncbi:TyrR family helix-turn-helix domain-containing protein [Rhodoblastus acidophilus]|uniref:HTH-type transcriptional regulatory protein TyrR n=1 Tax=Rhodoblastus acidophilus TaxID=1074 RepID=A0A212PWH0_RHOAC|nr:sigma 54-interacting transcriptional regulator [Rhodoblastus acidophilus]PPQ37806.1 Fis family transcriptional regulator [Rhodoblastus acidophilus]RAI17204.1 Fis family transcriptional regulator [Rhodoblastus acidophilus]SNB51243.1 TyrR family helix-turn-helix domain-containing protein [Rhodoblastus acidophilus]